MVLCFSPVGFILRTRARKFPALVNCTAIDWFHPWPQHALQSVSSTFIQNISGLEVTETRDSERDMFFVINTRYIKLIKSNIYNFTIYFSFTQMLLIVTLFIKES